MSARTKKTARAERHARWVKRTIKQRQRGKLVRTFTNLRKRCVEVYGPVEEVSP